MKKTIELIKESFKGDQSSLFISVDYEEWQPETYRGISVKTLEGKLIFFVNTGDFISDYRLISKMLDSYKENSDVTVLETSSVHDYFMDANL